MSGLLQPVRYALRQLRRSPGFTITVVATLAIGIGLNTAIFTVVDSVLLRPLGYHGADRIVALRSHFTADDRSINLMGGGDFADLARDVKGLESAAWYNGGPDGVEANGAAMYLPVALVSPQFVQVMGVAPVAGRLFNPGDTAGSDVLVAAAFAREHFGSAERALGQTLRYNGLQRPIIGVLPDGFSFPNKAQVWLEGPSVPSWGGRTSYSQSVVGRRRADVSDARLGAELATFSNRLQQNFPEDRGKTIEAVSLQEQIVGAIRPTLRLLLGAVGVVLLVVAVNLTHLQLVRSTQQLRSVTVRSALGATRTALASLALVEVGLLAAGGFAGALLLAVPVLRLLVRLAPPELPRLADVHLNGSVLAFSLAVSLVVMALTAFLPVWRAWHLNPALALKQDSARGTESRGALRLRNSFVVLEVALTLMLSVGALLLTRQLVAQARETLGFPAESIVVLDAHAVSSEPPIADPAPNSKPEALTAYFAALRGRGERQLQRLDSALGTVRETPGVQQASAMLGAPMGYSRVNVGYAIRGRQVFTAGADLPVAFVHAASPTLFATLEMPLLRGRLFTEADRSSSPLVVVINKTLADRMFANQDPLGQQIACGLDDPDAPWWTIIGVVGDIRDQAPGEPPSPTFYIPLAQHPLAADQLQIMARTATDPAAMVETLRRRLHQTHPEIAVKGATMRENIGMTQQAEHFRTALLSGFAGVSILLAAVGMYGITAYSVAQRRFEFGLRLALGASRSQVLGSVMRGAVAVAALGALIGSLLSLGLTHVLAHVVGKLPAFDTAAYTTAAALVLLLALLATLLPASSAAGTEPMHVLRGE